MSAGEPSRLASIAIAGPAGNLEGLLQHHADHTPALAALVLHPHPLYGGTLHNKVVHRVASTLHQLGADVLRINFRGVGGSEGHHDRGVGELEDARAAWRWLGERYPHARRWLAGFSFGSWIAARLAASEPHVERLVLVAPSVRVSSFEVLRTCTVPKLIVQGTADDVCPIEFLRAEFPTWAEPRTLIEVDGASHFFDRRLGALGDALRGALEGFARGATA
ncbi:MAG TPA: alpha/beta fold hydrolase [Candidatus Eisenbacteria bacterium]|nr:alpha/beta fold hydrolase [Candidatus Eisenbacteria bacterium]